MARLYDLMIADDSLPNAYRSNRLERIVCDDLWDKVGGSKFSDLPPVRPPFSATWMEFKIPYTDRLAADSKRRYPHLPVANGGVWRGAVVLCYPAEAENYGPGTEDYGLPSELPRRCAAGEAGVISFRIILRDRSLYEFTDVGVYCDASWKIKEVLVKPGLTDDPYKVEAVQDAACNAVGVFLLSLGLMNCKNIALEAQCPYDEALQKARVRRGKLPFFDYHVLRIDPSKTRTRTIGGPVQHDSDPKRLHICRGHFKTYTDERPLFGRVTGTFWIPQHMRGDIDAGVLAKDYQVVAPAAGTVF